MLIIGARARALFFTAGVILIGGTRVSLSLFKYASSAFASRLFSLQHTFRSVSSWPLPVACPILHARNSVYRNAILVVLVFCFQKEICPICQIYQKSCPAPAYALLLPKRREKAMVRRHVCVRLHYVASLPELSLLKLNLYHANVCLDAQFP